MQAQVRRIITAFNGWYDVWPLTGSILVSPHTRLERPALIAVTAAAVLLGLAASQFGVRFDGFLNVRSEPDPVPLPIAFADQIVCVFLPAVIAWLIVQALAGRPRFDALFLTFGVIRVPLVLVAPAALVMDQPDPPSAAVLSVIVAALLAWAWVVALLVNGVRYSTSRLAGWRFWCAVVSILIAAELVSTLAMSTVD
jgi:hypothetical protein